MEENNYESMLIKEVELDGNIKMDELLKIIRKTIKPYEDDANRRKNASDYYNGAVNCAESIVEELMDYGKSVTRKEELAILTEAYEKGFNGNRKYTKEELKQAKEFLHIVNEEITEEFLLKNNINKKEVPFPSHTYYSLSKKKDLMMDENHCLYCGYQPIGRIKYIYQLINFFKYTGEPFVAIGLVNDLRQTK